LLSSPGLEPALYPDTPVYRGVLARYASGRVGDADDSMTGLLDLLDRDERPLRLLSAVQFALDPTLQQRLDRRAVRRLKAAVTDGTMAWSARFWLFDLARRMPDRFGSRWLRSTGQHILATAPLAGYGDPDNAGDLVGAAFLQADLEGWEIDEDVLERWLSSDSLALAERALVQMRRQDPALETASLQRALARADLPDAARAFLQAHQRRLDRGGASHDDG
jgi:hypothetical protein